MKRILVLLLVLLFPVAAASADPVILAGDLTGIVSETNYEYSYCYPQVDPSDPNASINNFFSELVEDAVDMQIPSAAQDYASSGDSISVRITYDITLNNEEFLSLRICNASVYQDAGGTTIEYETWKGYTFSLLSGMPGQTSTLSHILGILSSSETDEWLEERQEGKVNDAVLALVWDRISSNPDLAEYFSGMTAEDLDFFNPDSDFWLDETGNPVFYLQLYLPADDESEQWENILLTFPISLEEIDDEI